jgi:hypothetical protein
VYNHPDTWNPRIILEVQTRYIVHLYQQHFSPDTPSGVHKCNPVVPCFFMVYTDIHGTNFICHVSMLGMQFSTVYVANRQPMFFNKPWKIRLKIVGKKIIRCVPGIL